MTAGSASPAALAALLDEARWPELAGALGDWLPGQRWFQGKARVVSGLRVTETVLLVEEPEVVAALVEVSYAPGGREDYQVLLAAHGAGDPPPVARVADTPLVDALARDDACRALAARMLAGGSRPTGTGGEVTASPAAGAWALPDGPVRRLGVEQSNSSVVLADHAMLKVFRRLEPGLNPDVEITRRLTELDFAHVPAQAAALLLRRDGGEQALAVLTEFVPGAGEGWALARAEAERVAAGAPAGDLAGGVGALGEVLAALHAALQRAFGDRPGTPDDTADWAEAMERQARAVLASAQRRVPEAVAPVLARGDDLRRRLAATAEVRAPGPLLRTHGDLHLGQVLHHPERGWLVLDFEGEPARPLAERRRRHSPLRDVAGMLRSFDYAAARPGGERDAPADDAATAALAAWRDRLRAAFRDAYLDAAGDAGLLPDPAASAALLDAFELDKAVYELGYELANRPGWVDVPIGGILRLLDRRTMSRGRDL